MRRRRSCQKGEKCHGPRVWQKRKEQEKQKKKQTNQTPPPATAEKNKIKQPHIRLALSRAGTLIAIWTLPPSASAAASRPTRAARQVTLTTWRVERLPFRNSSISIKRRRTLDSGWDLAADEAGSSAADAILAA